MTAGAARTQVEKILLRVLTAWETSSHTLDYLLHRELGQSSLLPRDKAQITDYASGWARGRGAARYLLNNFLPKGLESLPDRMRLQLEVAVCRLLFEERTPAAIVVSSTVQNLKSQYGETLSGLANALLRRLTAKSLPWPDAQTDLTAHLAAKYSHPDWLVARWLDRWGEDRTRAQLVWDNRRPDLWLRWNGNPGDLGQADLILKKAGLAVAASPTFSGYFRLLEAFYPKAHELVQRGDFSVQDPSASLAIDLLDPQPEMRILDLCAAPGGKTLLIAQRMGDQADITAVDSSSDRLKKLQKALQASHFTTVKTIVADGRSLGTELFKPDSFEAVLVDVPCSGLGVLNRRADLRWRRQPEDLTGLTSLQKELLQSASQLVRPGGSLVYSTCTLEPEENQAIVNDFLQNHPQFTWGTRAEASRPEYQISPAEIETYSPRDGLDGVYAALLLKLN